MKIIATFALIGLFSQASFALASSSPPAFIDCESDPVVTCKPNNVYLFMDHDYRTSISGHYTFNGGYSKGGTTDFAYYYSNDKGGSFKLRPRYVVLRIGNDIPNNQWHKTSEDGDYACGSDVTKCPFTDLPF